jgi:hypothetical protein
MKRKMFIGLLCLVLMSCFIPFVKADDWVLVEKTGDWAICETNHWKAVSGQYQGEVLFSYGQLSNFTGYYGRIYLISIDAWTTSIWLWDSSCLKEAFVWLDFDGANTNVKVGIRFHKKVDLYGLLGGSGIMACILINSTEYNFDYAVYMSALGSQNYVDVYVSREGDVLKIKVYHYASLFEKPTLLNEKDIQVGASWFSNVSVKMKVSHETIASYGWTSRNDGSFEAGIIDENFEFIPSQYPETKSPAESIWDSFIRGLIGIINVIPQWVRNALNYLYDGLKWIGGLFVTFFGIVLQMFPLFLPIILFWFIDAVITSIEEGSFQPIGNVVYSIYEFVRGIIQTLANILQTIWDILTFWS